MVYIVLIVLYYIQIIAEGANGPITPMADRILQENNVLVIPVRLCMCTVVVCVLLCIICTHWYIK